LAALTAQSAGCGAPPAEGPSAAAPPAPPAAAKPSAEAAPAATPFENPGGMWMPEQLASHEEPLRKLGFQMDPKVLTDPTAFPLGAVVSLGGCSASFISPEGLIATNHHCARGALLHNSTPKENMLQDGFLAKSRAEERWAGPTARVYVTRALRDVTKDVRAGLEAIESPLERHRKIEERTKQIVAACEKGRPATRCSVAEYFGGAAYRLIEQLEIKDLRMVYVPPEGIGGFGGDIDNWRWPRHSGDFAILRAYVGKDGQPADHAATNVPYAPPHHLKLASAPLKAGDFVMVAGYPGKTNRLRTAAEVESAVSWEYPERVKLYEELIAFLQEVSKKDEATKIKATPRIEGLSNYLIKTQGLLDGLVKGGLAKEKAAIEAKLAGWIEADPARKAAYGGVIDRMAKLHAEQQKTREHDALLSGASWLVGLVDAGNTIVRMAEERPKPDAERDPAYQERNWQRLGQGQLALQKRYDRAIDQGLLKVFLQRMGRLPEQDRPALYTALLGKKEPTEANIDKAVADLYGKTKLEDQAARVKLLQTATLADLQRSKDPIIKLALAIRPAMKALEEREDAYHGAMAVERPLYVKALEQFQGGALAPDANGTLRITYGTVRGYQASADAPAHKPFTVLSEVVKKSTGKEPFEAPEALLSAANAKKVGPYVAEELGEVPVDFLSDLDITGGNSGSATLNARGELVGLAFDGNYESMASDWLFMPKVTRTIHVDLRYMLWVMDAVAGADHVLQEMGAKPAL
ncbi:MAG TPA: S46 family peptidase, partial [Candidatus Nanopelagicales bacterium]|nr:S46 family peptidase [Candidatus Nanopelagicales bacterium]